MSVYIDRIESLQNSRFKSVCQLRTQPAGRSRQSGLSIMEGMHLLDEALKRAPLRIREVWVPEQLAGNDEWESLFPKLKECRVFEVPEALWKKLSGLENSSGPLTVFEVPSTTGPLDANQNLLVLDGLQDPGNVGTLLRVAAGAGITQLACMPGTCWIWSEKAMRAGMGAQWAFKEIAGDSTDILAQMTVAVTHLSDRSQSLYDLDLRKPIAWVFGSEGRGVSNTWLDERSWFVKIPQSEAIESLNVAASAAVVLFEQRRQLLKV